MKGFTFSEAGVSFSMNGLLNHQNPCANEFGFPKIVIIYEDEIETVQLSSFLSLFRQVAPENRPSIIFVGESPFQEAARKISACGDNINIAFLSPSGLQTATISPPSVSSTLEMLNHFLAEADGSCLATNSNDLDLGQDAEGTLIRIAVEMIQVQSHFRAGRKFEPSQQVLDLQRRLQLIWECEQNGPLREELLGFKALLNLWEVYLFEKRGHAVENTLSIARHLKNDLLMAHALKQTPLLHGYGELTRQNLMRAKVIFTSHAEQEQAVFVDNNIIVNDSYSELDATQKSTNLSDYVSEFLPYIRRSTTIHSNAGITCLINGHVERSRLYFDRAVAGAGPAVNRLTSEINRNIARYINGEQIQEDEAENFLRKLDRARISKEFDYHQTEMLANMWKIFENNGEVRLEIVEYLRRKKFLPYDNHLASPESLLKFAIFEAQSVRKSTPVKKLPGKIGHFFEQHGLLPAAHVFYR